MWARSAQAAASAAGRTPRRRAASPGRRCSAAGVWLSRSAGRISREVRPALVWGRRSMPLGAIALLAFAELLHGVGNLPSKRSHDNPAFFWLLLGGIALAGLAPFALHVSP